MLNVQDIEFIKIVGKDFSKYKDVVAKLRIEIFKAFPYLYEGDFEYEKKYLKVYENSARSIIVLVKHNDNFIGATTALPLFDENDYIKLPFEKIKMPVEKIFYFGESILKESYRGLGIGKKFFQIRENHMHSYNSYDFSCFCGVNRESTHKAKPKNYVALDEFWLKLGYRKEPSITAEFSWKDIGDKSETKKQMTYWMKNWKK